MSNKEKYREFCKIENSIPIFSKDWWLDSVCGKSNWDVVIVEKGEQIWATLPYCKSQKFIFSLIHMPKLTQTMGPYIKYPQNQKYYKRLSWEKEMMQALISQLPKYDYFSQNFHRTISNWLPFYWDGFKQTSKYSYIIEESSLQNLEKNYETDIRRRLRKVSELGIIVYESNDIKKFYELNKMTFERQNMQIPYTFNFILHLNDKCREHAACKMYFAKDHQNNIIAANFIVYDDYTVYYLMGGIDPNKKDIGGMDAVLTESIKFALESGRKFDFEGSMIESIEKYFRSFGAIQMSYFNISKINSKLLKTQRFFKEILK